MAKRTRAERKADNIAAETQRRIDQGDRSSYVQQQVRENQHQFQNTGQTNNISDAMDLISSSKTPYGGYRTAGEQAAASWKAAGMVSGSGVSGTGLWKTAPVGTTDPKVLEYLKNPNVYYSTYGKGADAYTTAFQDDLTGYGGLVYSDPYNYDPYNRGYFTPFNPANYPDQYPGFGGGGGYGGGGGGGGAWGSGGGGGGGGGSSSINPPEQFTPRGQPGERWGQQNPLQQMMINIHGGQGFKQGFDRGGIVGLVT